MINKRKLSLVNRFYCTSSFDKLKGLKKAPLVNLCNYKKKYAQINYPNIN